MKQCMYGLLLLAIPNILFADGKVFKSWDMSSFIPVAEDSQHAIIAHKDGREAMLLAVNFSLEDKEKAFWLFPVPGKPDEINADVVDVFPWIRGTDPTMHAKGKFQMFFGIQLLSQPYTWPFMCCMPAFGTLEGKDIDLINITSVVEKHGLRVEMLSAETINSLAKYLDGKGIKIEDPELEAFSDYLNSQYSLIFVEIYSKEGLLKEFPDYEGSHRGGKGRWPTVFVEFPSEEIYFPLKPTGSYEGLLSIVVKVFGYVKSETELSASWRVGYYKQIKANEPFPDIFKTYLTEEPLQYTSYFFRGEAKELTEDMRMLPFEPKSIKYAQSVDDFAAIGGGYLMIILGIALFLVQSWACAGLSGLFLYKKWHPYSMMGLGNIISLLGVYLLAKYGRGFLETELQGSDNKPKSFRLHHYGKKETKRTWFLFLFSFFFLVSSIGLYVLLNLPFYGT